LTVAPLSNRQGQLRRLLLLAGGVGGFVVAGLFVLISYALSPDSSDVFIPEWIVFLVFGVLAGAFGLAGGFVALLVLRGLRRLSSAVQIVAIFVATYLVGIVGYLVLAGWWGPTFGFFVGGAVVSVPLSVAAIVGNRVFSSQPQDSSLV
jgi:hypothetical protein